MYMKQGLINKVTGFILILTLFMFSSCGSTKSVIYFPTVKDGIIQSTTAFPESIIQKNDILSIVVSSPNPEATTCGITRLRGGGNSFRNSPAHKSQSGELFPWSGS